MKVYILCNTLKGCDYSYPHPFNQINLQPSIYYTAKFIPPYIKTLNIIMSQELEKYNFQNVIKFTLRNRDCNFIYDTDITNINFEKKIYDITSSIDETDNEPLLFIETKVIYDFENFDNTSLFTNNSFVAVTNNKYSGIFGFKNMLSLRDAITNMCSFDDFFKCATQITLPGNIYSVETYDKIKSNIEHFKPSQMRICFDLDNTLVTPPYILRDYSTVKPIQNMIDLAKKLKSEGHIIIIHTARKMLSNSHNTGAAIANIAKLTIETLDNFEIPYDELIFGKPYAEIYIDDKAFNPYVNSFESVGLIT